MPRYRSVAPFPISPSPDGTVAPGDLVTLDEDLAGGEVTAGHLVLVDGPSPAPDPAPEAPAATPSSDEIPASPVPAKAAAKKPAPTTPTAPKRPALKDNA